MASRKRSLTNDADSCALHKEWDEVLCPICMDHPHNAVLIMCSSHDKGCRSYICDTSYRHSNCLDRFKKLRTESNDSPSSPALFPRSEHISSISSERNYGFGPTTESAEVNALNANDGNIPEERSSLRCPLCRGSILGYEVVGEARNYLDSKIRSCSHESCSFTGSYGQLRKHARRIHPSARPTNVDPSRERAWRRLQNQRAYGDIMSALRTATPDSVVVGDYVIEENAEDELGDMSDNAAAMWTTLFFFHMLGSTNGVTAERRYVRSSRGSSTRHLHSSGTSPQRRVLWGRNLLGVHDDDDDDYNDGDIRGHNGDSSSGGRTRRRLT